ncbi:unnamed protein product, partial [Prorocentrum cordatum]
MSHDSSSDEDFCAKSSSGPCGDEDLLADVELAPRAAEPLSDEEFFACNSDDEPLVVAGGPRQAAAESDGPSLDSVLVLTAAAAYTPPPVVKRGRHSHILSKAGQEPARRLQPLPSEMLVSGVPRVAAFLLGTAVHRSTALATAEKLRRECGVAAASWHETCDAISRATFRALRGTFERFARTESTNAALAHLERSVDLELERTFLRGVDFVMTDEAGSNIRYENARQAASSRPSALLHMFCGTHKKAKAASLGRAVQKPADTMIIRMHLVRRANMPRAMKAMRDVLAEQLVIIQGGPMGGADVSYAQRVYDAFLPVRPSSDRFRRRLVQGLWNGNLRCSGRIEHMRTGRCKSRGQTLYLMQTCGLRALTKHMGHVMDRQNWTAGAGDGQGGDLGMVNGDGDAEKVIRPCDEMILKELERSGVEWGLKQQQELLEQGQRTYPLWEAADCKDVKRVRQRFGELVFNDRWQLLSSPAEVQQLQLFTLRPRISASACELVEVRHSKTPCIMHGSLRNPQDLRDLGRAPRCTLDSYTEDFMNYYSERGGADGGMARSELAGALPLTQTNSAAAERSRSENLMRGKSQHFAWGIGAMSLSGFFLFRRAWKWQRSVFRRWGDCASGGARRGRSLQSQRSRRPQHKNAWVRRAFVHMEAGGAPIDQSLGPELSARFHSLSPELREPCEDAAAVAIQEHLAGRRAFGPSARASRGGAPSGTGRRVVARGAAAPVDHGSGAMPVFDVGAFVSDNVIFQGALVDMKTQKAKVKRGAGEVRAAAARLHQQSGAESPGLGRDWSLAAGGAPASPAAGLAVQRRMVPSLQCTRTPSSILAEALRALDISSIEREANEWAKLRKHTAEAECPVLGAPTRPRRMCWEAGYCICSGPRSHAQLQVVWRVLSRTLGEKVLLAKLGDGALVLRFARAGAPAAHGPAPSSDAAPGSALAPSGHAEGAERLYHVVLHYGKPWRPTFTRMRLEPLEDRYGLNGVAPEFVGAGDGGRCMRDLTVFQVVRQCFDTAWIKQPINIRVQELVADSRRAAVCQPWRQRILDAPPLESDVWELRPPPPKPRKRMAVPGGEVSYYASGRRFTS